MTRDEMLKGLENGRDPLELSIQKWQDIVDAFEKGKSLEEIFSLQDGLKNCALCETYYDYEMCGDCPVAQNGFPGCYDTPFEDFERSGGRNDHKLAAVQEVQFLTSLRRKK